ncbi:hypothetical protein FACS1894193_08210 [Bacilli bacterium]|nr:hypothetical protein FACS1894192_02630 [Bacilli bacterium]GHU42595.1 hypothetical protein FACS1894193_08210 [Bacilli bacterium]
MLKKKMRWLLAGLFVWVLMGNFSALGGAEVIVASQTSIEVKGDIQPPLPHTSALNRGNLLENNPRSTSDKYKMLPETGEKGGVSTGLFGITLITLSILSLKIRQIA